MRVHRARSIAKPIIVTLHTTCMILLALCHTARCATAQHADVQAHHCLWLLRLQLKLGSQHYLVTWQGSHGLSSNGERP